MQRRDIVNALVDLLHIERWQAENLIRKAMREGYRYTDTGGTHNGTVGIR